MKGPYQESKHEKSSFKAKFLRQNLPLKRPTPLIASIQSNGQPFIQTARYSTGGWIPNAPRIVVPYLMQEDLYLACEEGDVPAIKSLIERTDDVCNVDHEDCLAVCVAASKGQKDALEFLLSLMQPLFYSRVFESALLGGKLDVASALLLKDGVLVSDAAFEHLILEDSENVLVEGLFNSGRANPSDRALEMACMLGRLRLVDLLLEKGVKISQKAVDLAFQSNRMDLAARLLPSSENLSKTLISAISSRNAELVKLVLSDARAKGLQFDSSGIMAAWAKEGAKENVLNVLQSAGFDLSAHSDVVLRCIFSVCNESGEWDLALSVLRHEALDLRKGASSLYSSLYSCPLDVTLAILAHSSLGDMADRLPFIQQFCVVSCRRSDESFESC